MRFTSSNRIIDPDEVAIRLMRARREGRHRKEKEDIEDTT